MPKMSPTLVCAVLLAATAAGIVQASGRDGHDQDHGRDSWSFRRVSTFANYRNVGNVNELTVAEIVAATADGRTLVYTDAERGTLGFIDISDPARPLAGGTLPLDPDKADSVSYTPTSVDVLRNQYALVAVDTSPSKAEPSGSLLVIDLDSRLTVATLDLGGQPDSVKISPDRRFVAIAVENERDETKPLPQAPAGYLAVVRTAGHPASWTVDRVELTGLAAPDRFPEDPEPEFVDVNRANEAVVTLQENNHVVIVDLARLKVVRHFPAGKVSLAQIDTVRAGSGTPNTIALVNAADRLREPDAVTWIGGHLATANEGDLEGGSRGFTLFDRAGSVLFDSGNTFEHLGVRLGHYPDRRSSSKGTEPEAIASAKYGPHEYLFVGSERGSFVAVYRVGRDGQPDFVQLLPAPLAPEGLLAIPHRNLLVASGEGDTPPYGVRSTVMIYRLEPGPAVYPQIVSANESVGGASSTPIPWSALSGLTEVPGEHGKVQAVWDSFFTPTRVFTLDVTRRPAVVTDALTVLRPEKSPFYDPEGIAYTPDGRELWIASEGNLDDSRPNRLIRVDPVTGEVEEEIGLPPEVLACRAAERDKAKLTPTPPNGTGTFGSGFEGLDIVAKRRSSGHLIYVAQQRGWNYTTSGCEALDDDPSDTDALEPRSTRIWIYDTDRGTWTHVRYELQPKPANAAWVGLSEITRVDHGWIVIERDNLTGDFGALKTLVRLPLNPGPDGFTQGEKDVFDLGPRLRASRGWITDKPEGVAVLPDGRLFVVTDNDGVDGWSGETWFLRLGPYWALFR